MTTIQLTLNVEDGIAEKLKAYTERQHTDLNKLVEAHLSEIATQEGQVDEVFPPVKQLKDLPEWLQSIVLSKEPTSDFDEKKARYEYLKEKYGL